ncbi:MAG: tyrosine-type recombinase/integrase [Kiritimatiellae bacterium]|nr:tyrosine-type recombinase/integrase [Kiritimatiellia bacterium]
MKQSNKSNGRRKRAERGTGRLFKKVGSKQVAADSPAAGVFYLTYTVEKKRKTVALKDESGKAITDRKTAEIERKRILAPYQTGNQVEALKAIENRIRDAEQDHAAAIDEANPPLQIKDAWAAYLRAPERPDSGPATLRQYEGHWTRFQNWITEAHTAAAYLRDVTPATAADYAADLTAAGLSPNRFNKHIGFLRLAFRSLADVARITANPFEKIKRKVQRPHSKRELTIPELTAILDRAEGDLALLLYLGACTGLRLGDCATLTWGEVDLARGIIRRIPNKTARSGKPVVVGIPPALHERLSETPAKKRTGFVLPDIEKQYHRDAVKITNAVRAHIWECGIDTHAPATGHRIKRDADGTPERDDAGKVITEATGKTAVVDVGFHSLRHTWVSMHAAAGTPGAIIQASVGHSNPAMTQHYTHVNEITARDVAQALPAFSGNGETHREPLPDWARELVESLTAKNVKTIKAELLEGGAE